MAVVTICSDFGAPKIKSVTVSTVSPPICHEVMGPVVMYGCKSWTERKLTAEELMLLNYGVGEDA